MEINSNNFLRWDSNPAIADSKEIPNPNPYEKCGYPYMPIFVPGEIVSFYVNADTSGGSVGIETLSGSSAGTLGSAVPVANGDDMNAYCTAAVPDIPEGFYRLTLDGMKSNPIWVQKNGYQNKSCKVKFRNNGRNLYGVNYLDLEDFYQEFRIHVFYLDGQSEYDLEQYRSSSSGKLRNLNGSVDRFVKFRSYFFDKGAHEACAAMLFHSEIWINGKQYMFKTGYTNEPMLGSLRSNGEFELWDQEYSQLNKC